MYSKNPQQEGESMDPERKANHWSARTVLTKEEGGEVKGIENDGQGKVDEGDPLGRSPRARQRMAV